MSRIVKVNQNDYRLQVKSGGIITLDVGNSPGKIAITGNLSLAGSIINGAWRGSTVAVPYGGTGATSLTGYLKGNGDSAFTAVATIPSTDITGFGSIATQDSDSVTITGGTANDLIIGDVTPAAAIFSTLRINSTLSMAGSTGTLGQVLASNGDSAPTWQYIPGTGTVTSVSGIGAVNGLYLAGTVTGTGNLTLGGSVTNVALTTGTITTPPSSSSDIVNKSYADSIATGINFHNACQYATTAALPSNNYDNGISGVGATLTASAVGILTIDGHTVVSPADVGMRVLIKNEVSQIKNGVYTVTTVGDVSTRYVLTRATDYDTTGSGTNEIDQGDMILVISGTSNANTSWVQQTKTPTVGSGNIIFLQFAAIQTYTAGANLTLLGNQFSAIGTVAGPSSSINNAIVLFDGTTGALIKTGINSDAVIRNMTLGLGSGSGNFGSTALGGNVLKNNTTGSYNVAVGYEALLSNTTGQYLSAFGFSALKAHQSGTENSAFGYYALQSVTSGNYNTGLGGFTGSSLTTGSNNLFLGVDSGASLITGSNNVYIGKCTAFSSSESNVIAFGNGFGERWRITDTGAWYINGSTGTYPQVLMSAGSASSPSWQSLGAMAQQNNYSVAIYGGYIDGTIIGSSTAAAGAFTSIGIGTAASGTTGEIRATNNITAYYSSDRSLKENIKTIPDALDKVGIIGGKTFDWTDEYIKKQGGEDGYFVRKSDFGVIAQDVQSVFPEAVRERTDGTLAVDYEKLVALAFAAIVELRAEVKSLRGE